SLRLRSNAVRCSPATLAIFVALRRTNSPCLPDGRLFRFGRCSAPTPSTQSHVPRLFKNINGGRVIAATENRIPRHEHIGLATSARGFGVDATIHFNERAGSHARELF